MRQQSFSDRFSGGWSKRQKPTRRARFLGEMDRVVPWSLFVQTIAPYYPRAGRQGGRPAYPLEVMLRIYFVQQWYDLSDPGVEESLYDIAVLRDFVGVSLEGIPDETTVLHFRHFLEKHHLQEQLFEVVRYLLSERGLLMKQGTIVDATTIEAPRSTKNRRRSRDPEMASVAKGQQWFFGMKAHVGADSHSGMVHTLLGTAANVHDGSQLPRLLEGNEQSVFGDKGYDSKSNHDHLQAHGIKDGIQRRIWKSSTDEEKQQRQAANHCHGKVRTKVEHIFRVIKCQFGYRKVRYQGLSKNTCHLYMLFALANLYQARKHRTFLPAT